MNVYSGIFWWPNPHYPRIADKTKFHVERYLYFARIPQLTICTSYIIHVAVAKCSYHGDYAQFIKKHHLSSFSEI
jgi:hypothetical protein